jgi:N-acyl amino acid synthase of PEP-CTERM/exosortase system
MTVNQPSQYFDFVRVNVGNGLWDDVQRLRFDVYCQEMHFLDAAHYPTGLESDEFDLHSAQFAAINNEKEVISTLRLVRDEGLGFPLEHHGDALYPSFHELPRERTVEVSRLILAKRYRRRANDTRYGTSVGPDPTVGTGDPSHPAQRRSPYPLILFGLFRCMFEESLNTGLEYWLAAMEPWLRTFLARFGFTFTPIGDPIEYYGQVIPYSAKVEDIFKTVSEMRPDVLKIVLGGGDDAPDQG